MRADRSMMVVAALVAGLGFAVPQASAQGTTTYRYERRTEVHTVTPERDGDWTRFRFGISGVGGGLVNGPEIGMGGVSLRAGIQVGDLFGVYYMPVGLVGALYARPDGAAAAGLLFNNAMVDFTIADMFTFGVGPSLDFIWGCSDTYQTESDCDTADPFFGANGRVALNLLPMGGPGSRHAMTISFDVHPTVFSWEDEVVGVTMLGGLGFEMF